MVFGLIALLLAGPGLAQDKGLDNKRKQKELEQQRKKKEEEIKLTKKLLNQTEKEKKKSLNQLHLLNKQIRMRESLIQTVNQEIEGIDGQIFTKRDDIDALLADLEVRKKEYADMVYLAYKNKRVFDPLTFVLSASSFHQAARRIEFLRSLSASRTLQMELIRQTQKDLENELAQLERIRNEKSSLLSKKEEEKTELEEDKKEENQIVGSLKSKEKELKKELKAKRKAAKKLDDAIARIIREEIERARKEEEARLKKAGKTEKKGTELAMTPEAVALSASFTANKGKLPWPVEKGFIIRSFGEHRHPTLPNVKTVNNGIDIVTTDGSNARAVFQGEVRAIFNVPGMQNAVMINHGEFFTVYTHLETVLVKKGDKVTTKQNLGKVYKDPDDGKSIVHFELWQGNVKQNPETWIYSK
ncbi:MAG TPA: peptidase M23 [Bacteroidetes bacterium]|nr:peptidase M23 [Bacteroidota bacterium]